MVNFGPLAAEISWRVWGIPANFNRVSRLGNVTAQHSGGGLQPNFAVLSRGRRLYSAGRPSRGHWPTFLVNGCFLNEPGLANFLWVFCLHVFWKRTLEISGTPDVVCVPELTVFKHLSEDCSLCYLCYFVIISSYG